MAKKEKGTGFWADFKKFISRGNVVDMAVGVVIGGAFGKIVTGLVNNIINPLVCLITGGVSLDGVKTVLKEAVPATETAAEVPEVAILWGAWIQTIIDFLIVAFCIFAVIRVITKAGEKMHAKELAEKAAAEKAEAEKAEADKAAAEEAAAAKAAEDAAFRASVMAQEKLLAEIRDSLKKN
ncbi:MAG: large conductance mechanosensitive channel protein MscL [Clostridia bacterium]|nr:large conductance mechanosensitive channel protein MscL [Clostridia bacterium]